MGVYPSNSIYYWYTKWAFTPCQFGRITDVRAILGKTLPIRQNNRYSCCHEWLLHSSQFTKHFVYGPAWSLTNGSNLNCSTSSARVSFSLCGGIHPTLACFSQSANGTFWQLEKFFIWNFTSLLLSSVSGSVFDRCKITVREMAADVHLDGKYLLIIMT